MTYMYLGTFVVFNNFDFEGFGLSKTTVISRQYSEFSVGQVCLLKILFRGIYKLQYLPFIHDELNMGNLRAIILFTIF